MGRSHCWWLDCIKQQRKGKKKGKEKKKERKITWPKPSSELMADPEAGTMSVTFRGGKAHSTSPVECQSRSCTHTMGT